MLHIIPCFQFSDTGQLIFLLLLLFAILWVYFSRRKMSERLWQSAVEENSVERLVGMVAMQMNYHCHIDTDNDQVVTHFMVPFLGDIACKRTYDGTPIMYISKLKEDKIITRSQAEDLRNRFNNNSTGEYLGFTMEGDKLVWSLTLTLNTNMLQSKEMAKSILRQYINRAKEIQKSLS